MIVGAGGLGDEAGGLLPPELLPPVQEPALVGKDLDVSVL